LALNGATITETFGTLAVTNGGVIDFGVGSTQLTFSASSSLTWTGLLSLWNWDGSNDQLVFGNSATALTPEQMASVRFFSDNGETSLGGGVLRSDGSLVPVPEASSLVTPTILLLSLMARRRRGLNLSRRGMVTQEGINLDCSFSANFDTGTTPAGSAVYVNMRKVMRLVL
jgi:hypothetical protein